MALFGKKKQLKPPVPPPGQMVQPRPAGQGQPMPNPFQAGQISMRDFIAPSSLEFESDHMRIGTRLARTFYVYGYPRQLYTGWLSPLINLDEVLDISLFIYPVETGAVLRNLRTKVGQLEASIEIQQEKGRVRDPGLEAAITDAEELRDKLQVGEERFFRMGFYFTIYANSKEELEYIQRKVEGVLGQELLYSKAATLQMEQGLHSTAPQGLDQLLVRRNMSTGALGTSFPFTSAELTQEDGILYGINMHNNGLVLFDRFNMENANMVVFAKSGAGKSFTVKLEALRSLMFDAQIMIIDPENEYERLSKAVGGSYIEMSLGAGTHINPFDLPKVTDAEEAQNALRTNLITLHGMLRLMLGATSMGKEGLQFGQLSPQEQSDLDQAMIRTYAQVGITADPLTHQTTPPTMTDLYDVLLKTGDFGPSLAQRLRKYIEGTFSGIFSDQSNVELNNNFIVFNIRDLEEELRPVAMYIVLGYIWNKVKSDQRRRFLIVDEAWTLMQHDDSANFMFSIAKRARKYNLGLTTISQDVEDFLSSRMGRAIVANSSIQLLLKQAPSAVDVVASTFKLTDEEKKRLTRFPVGQGLFFAGNNHVHIRIDASPTEAELITTNPEQLRQIREREQRAITAGQAAPGMASVEAPEGDVRPTSALTPQEQAGAGDMMVPAASLPLQNQPTAEPSDMFDQPLAVEPTASLPPLETPPAVAPLSPLSPASFTPPSAVPPPAPTIPPAAPTAPGTGDLQPDQEADLHS